jgi:hypothetical protein
LKIKAFVEMPIKKAMNKTLENQWLRYAIGFVAA